VGGVKEDDMTTTEPNVNGAAQSGATNGAAKPPSEAAPAAALATRPSSNVDDVQGAIAVFSSQANFASAQRMAQALAASSLVPLAYQGSVPNCLIALEMAARIGASVFMVMQSLDIIHGRPGWRATFLIGTVNSSRRFTPLRFRFQGKPNSDDWGCRAFAKDRESGEECLGALITIGMAKAEGWYGRNGSKWKTMPEQMLQYRAASFWTRIFCPEISLGLMSSDEVVDTTGYSIQDVTTSTPITQGSIQDLEAQLLGRKVDTSPATVADAEIVDENTGEVSPAPSAKRGKKEEPPMREPGEDG
jgi:hypothetical protein